MLIRLLHLSADRLAARVDSLTPAAWDIDGRVAGGTVTVEELVHVPLHRSHRDLAERSADGAIVVPFGRHRREKPSPRAAQSPAAFPSAGAHAAVMRTQQ